MGRCAPYWTAFACFLLVAEGSGAAEFGWPLAVKPALSSTFGETRPTAFHAGVDLKTWGKTGCEVRALGAGQVWRLRTSPWGYGRVVYQKLEDGRILVYAHLQGFAPKLAQRVKQAQRQKQRYSVDVWFEEGELPLQAGEIIAWTGKSGAGPPHLHLELRNQDNVPVNPLVHGFAIEDAIAPTLQRIALLPFGLESTVEGKHEAASVGLSWSRDHGYFKTPEVLSVYGRIGVSVLGYDRTDAATNKLAPYRHTLIVDGRPVFATAYDRIPYSDGHQVFLDRMRLEYPGGAGRFYNLFLPRGNRLSFYERISGGDGLLHCGAGSGAIFLEKGLHQLVVESEDVTGNKSRALLYIKVNAPPSIGPLQLDEEEGGHFLRAALRDADDSHLEVELARSSRGEKWEIVERGQVRPSSSESMRWRLSSGAALWRLLVRDGAGGENFRTCVVPWRETGENFPSLVIERRAHPDLVELMLRFDQVLRKTPRIQVQDGSRRYILLPRQMGLKEYRGAIPLRPNGASTLKVTVRAQTVSGTQMEEKLSLAQQPIVPGRETRMEWDNGQVQLRVPRNSAYEMLFPQAEPISPTGTEHLVGTGIGYAFGPDGASFDRKVELALRYPEGTQNPEKLGIYREGSDGRWRFVDNELDLRQRRVSAQVRRFSRYALMGDVKPPVIDRVQPPSGAVVETRQPRLGAWIRDRGSGIGREEDVVLELDGKPLISTYDPEEHTVEYLVEEDLRPGSHRLVVRVRDNSGNRASIRSDFVVE